MSLTSLYKAFLHSPSTASLTDRATLHYIPTLTSVSEPQKIVKQLLSTQLKKRDEKVIDVIEGDHALVFEVETTLEFVSSGGAYLPGLDDNFLTDRVVTLPITHVVHFDGQGKIDGIRLSWDQGSLLKNIDVIGARGKNWPIRDGKDQIRLIASSVTAAARVAPTSAPVRQHADEITHTGKGPSANGQTSKTATRDPHASLSLFEARETVETESLPAVIAPRASAKPPPRDYHDLFVGGGPDKGQERPSTAGSGANGNQSEAAMAPKGGVGKNYLPSRLFDVDEPAPPGSPAKQGEGFYKPHPKKFNHFEFADGSEEQDKPKPSPPKPKSKHDAQWDFEDFATPQKPAQKIRGQDVRHFGWSDDEVNMDSPAKPKKVGKPRRDAETHFEFQDDGTPQGEKRPAGNPRGAAHNNGLGLYQNNLYDESGNNSPPKPPAQPLGNVTNINNHRKTFDSQFSMTDDSPKAKEQQKPVGGGGHQAAVRMMNSNWDAYDESPEQQSKKENVPVKRENVNPNRGTGIMTVGDGMGGMKGTSRQWGFGDDSDGEEVGGVNAAKYQRGVPGKKQGTGGTGGGFWDFEHQ
ncbi:MAG: hypothetical protein M1817_002439 [Caeruleum heppii]|nr:MAG: hypothetical protein M1817_002439 [Caeruleum heppii]